MNQIQRRDITFEVDRTRHIGAQLELASRQLEPGQTYLCVDDSGNEAIVLNDAGTVHQYQFRSGGLKVDDAVIPLLGFGIDWRIVVEVGEQVPLVAGVKYETELLYLDGWTDGDGSGTEGYDWHQYFDSDGTYLGADQHGIEPVMTRIAVRRHGPILK